MSNALNYRMPFGVPGNISRAAGRGDVESQAFNQALPFGAFGLPGKMLNGLFVPLSAVGDVAPYGWLVRPYPTVGLNPSDPLGVGVPNCGPGREADVLVRGYMIVNVGAGIAAQGGPVFVRYANPAAETPLGGIEAALVNNSTIALTNVTFMGSADPQGNVEIRFNI